MMRILDDGIDDKRLQLYLKSVLGISPDLQHIIDGRYALVLEGLMTSGNVLPDELWSEIVPHNLRLKFHNNPLFTSQELRSAIDYSLITHGMVDGSNFMVLMLQSLLRSDNPDDVDAAIAIFHEDTTDHYPFLLDNRIFDRIPVDVAQKIAKRDDVSAKVNYRAKMELLDPRLLFAISTTKFDPLLYQANPINISKRPDDSIIDLIYGYATVKSDNKMSAQRVTIDVIRSAIQSGIIDSITEADIKKFLIDEFISDPQLDYIGREYYSSFIELYAKAIFTFDKELMEAIEGFDLNSISEYFIKMKNRGDFLTRKDLKIIHDIYNEYNDDRGYCEVDTIELSESVMINYIAISGDCSFIKGSDEELSLYFSVDLFNKLCHATITFSEDEECVIARETIANVAEKLKAEGVWDDILNDYMSKPILYPAITNMFLIDPSKELVKEVTRGKSEHRAMFSSRIFDELESFFLQKKREWVRLNQLPQFRAQKTLLLVSVNQVKIKKGAANPVKKYCHSLLLTNKSYIA